MLQQRDEQQESNLSLVELAVGHWLYLMQFAGANSDTYQKVLVPLDMKEEATKALSQADELLRPEGEGILLHVITSDAKSSSTGEPIPDRLPQHEAVRFGAIEYLTGLVDRFGEGSGRWRCDVIEASSVAEGVIAYAEREGVDLIAIQESSKRGLGKLIRKSNAKKIQEKSPVEVRVFRVTKPARASDSARTSDSASK